MRMFLISYDLAKPHCNKHVIAQTIMTLGQSWARPLEQTWYVRAEAADETEIEARIAGLLDADDGLIVQAVRDDAVLTNTSMRWFRQRRAAVDLNEGSNVVVFPSALVVPIEPELPLAQAG